MPPKEGEIDGTVDTESTETSGTVDPKVTATPPGKEGLSQEQVNEIVGQARVEGRTTGRGALLKDLGFSSEEDAKAFVSKAREKEDAEKTETERLQAQLEKAQALAKDAENAKAQALAEAQTVKLRSAVEKEIVTNKELNINPLAQNDVWLFLSTTAVGEDGIHIDENGKVVGVEKALADLIKEKPYLASTQNEDETPGNQTRKTKGKVDAKNLGDETKTGKLDYPFPRL